MKILYIFPHPDDESFGPALAIARQVREGDDVHLLTLTRGEATKQRHRLGLSLGEMGEVRYREMLEVEKTLGLAGMTVLDFPDSGLAELDPRPLEEAVAREIRVVRPHVVVTYAVHGVSGFRDHLVTHAVVKRVFCQMRDEEPEVAPRRLALFTLAESDHADGFTTLATSDPEKIDVAIRVSEADVQVAEAALDCYVTYQEVIEKADPLGRTGRTVYFELFGESHSPPLESLAAGL
ncbi:MAG: PIG-L family deacetylase [Gemmatimonadales bacterium]|nr:MAG: PIG-L family deacetylase [Gemmatimonadales bacterium]